MIRIDSIQQPDTNFSNNEAHQGQITPANSVMQISSAALAEVTEDALKETMEEMSLAMGNRLKSMQNKKEKINDSHIDALIQLINELEDEQAMHLKSLAQQFSGLAQSDNILAELNLAGLDKGGMLQALSALIAFGNLSPSQKKKLRKALLQLLAEENSDLAFFSALEGIPVNSNNLAALRQLHQRCETGEQGLIHWFTQIKKTPQRKQYIRVMLKTLSFELSSNPTFDTVKISSVIDDLRRLLIFLTLEDHCTLLGHAVNLAADDILEECLHIVEQSWVYPEWVEERIQTLTLAPARRPTYLRRWRELIATMPVDCFQEEEQREQIHEAMTTLLNQWSE